MTLTRWLTLLLNQLTQVTISFESETVQNNSVSSEEEKHFKNCEPRIHSAWIGLLFQKLENQLHGFDGLCCFKIKGKRRDKHLEKTSDGQSWKNDSWTSWSGYGTVRYPGLPSFIHSGAIISATRGRDEPTNNIGKLKNVRAWRLIGDNCHYHSYYFIQRWHKICKLI